MNNKFTTLLALSTLPLVIVAGFIFMDSVVLSIDSGSKFAMGVFHIVLTPINLLVLVYSLFTTQTILGYITGRSSEDSAQNTHLLILFYITVADFALTFVLFAISVYDCTVNYIKSHPNTVNVLFSVVTFSVTSLESLLLMVIHELHPDLFGKRLSREIRELKRRGG